MARRGRFGRSDTGASNLSTMIRSLVQQQQAQEEQAILNAFYNGTAYNGSVPSMSDISAYYNKIISDSGIDSSSPEYTLLQQKIGDANNFDIKREYNGLISDFNLNGGSNYDAVISFLEGRGQSSTNQNDLQDFQKAIGDVASAYVSFQANRLSKGSIGVTDFRSTVGSALSKMDPASEAYKNAVSMFKSSEWNAEKAHQESLLARKKITYSQFLSWAQDFKKSVTSTGVPMQDLMDVVDNSIYSIRQNAAAAAAASAVKAGKTTSATTESAILNLYAIAAASGKVPVTNVTLQKIANGDAFDMKDVVANPEVIATYIRLAKQDSSFINQDLVSMGITDGYSLDNYYNNELVSLHAANLKIYSITGNASDEANVKLTNKLYMTSGKASGLDEISDAATQYAQDLQKAGKDDVAISDAIMQWNNYLGGQQSKYGILPDGESVNFIPPEYSQERSLIRGYLQTSLDVAAGRTVPQQGQMTLEGALNITINNGTSDVNIQELYSNGMVLAAQTNLVHLLSGTAAQQVSVKNGKISIETIDVPAINARGQIGGTGVQANSGRLNQITFRLIGGKLRPVIQSVVSANPIMTPTGMTSAGVPEESLWGYKYILPSGEEVYVSASDGKTYNENPFKSVLGDSGDGKGSLVPVGDFSIRDGITSTDHVPAVDISSIYDAIGGDTNQVQLRNQAKLLATEWLDPALHPEMATMLQVVGSDSNSVSAAVDALNKRADEISLKNLQIQAFAASERGDSQVVDALNSQIIDLSNKVNPGTYDQNTVNSNAQYQNFVTNPKYKDYYIQTEPGVYVLKQQYQTQQQFENLKGVEAIAGGVAAGAAVGSAVPGFGTAIGGTIGGFLAGIPVAAGMIAGANALNPNSGQVSLPTVINTKGTSPSGYQSSYGFQQSNLTGNNPFFKNLSTASAKPYQTSYSPMAVNLPTVKVTAATVPTTKQQAQSLIAATPFNASDPEARRALVQLSSTLPSEKTVVPGPKMVAK